MFQHPILIVEDEPDGQEVVSRILRVVNIPYEVVGDGQEAWEMLQTRPYSAAIIDLALPGLNGMDLLRNVRRLAPNPALPCIAVTAYHTPELKREAIQEGFDAYFPKPLDRTMLVSALGNYADNS